jgi:hypothetical protein
MDKGHHVRDKTKTINTILVNNEQVGGQIESRHTVLLATQKHPPKWNSKDESDRPKDWKEH